MNTTILFIAGLIVFVLMLTGLYLTATEFIKVSDRPDLVKGRAPADRDTTRTAA